jgi:hypothetical protein
MKRKALLIGGPGMRGRDNYLPGVEKDLANYGAFLKTPLGGTWQPEEINSLLSPSKDEVNTAIGALKNVDYSFVVFTGHGFHGKSADETHVELRPGVEMNSIHLRTGAPKHTLILDCCRVVSKERITEALVKAAADRQLVTLNPSECRKYFDLRISRCAKGLVVIHACGKDETATENENNGGYYSHELIRGAINWRNEKNIDTSDSLSIRSIVRAHEGAADRVKKLTGGRQNPEIDKPRTEIHFPFAVIA